MEESDDTYQIWSSGFDNVEMRYPAYGGDVCKAYL